jgi:hypothetical protein
VTKIGRALDFYQKPSAWARGKGERHVTALKFLETKVDIFQV